MTSFCSVLAFRDIEILCCNPHACWTIGCNGKVYQCFNSAWV